MSDSYIDLVNSPLGATLAKKLGLPKPVRLRRHAPDRPLTAGPVLVLSDDASRPDADAIAAALLPWDLDRTRSMPAEVEAGEWTSTRYRSS